MRPFGQTSAPLRAVAALVSLTLTLAIFLLLRGTSLPAPARKAELQVSVTVFPLRPVPAKTVPATTTPATAALRSPAPIRPPRPIPSAVPQPDPAEALALPPAGIATEAAAASAPLRLDPQALARAIAGTEGGIRQMARRSGAELDSPRASRSELLATTVAEKGVPDCLAPNGGGSLLSAPILLLRALNGSCK